VRATGSGALAGVAEARSVLRNSTSLKLVEPKPAAGWDDAYARLVL
jgi:hypothetical protein